MCRGKLALGERGGEVWASGAFTGREKVVYGLGRIRERFHW